MAVTYPYPLAYLNDRLRIAEVDWTIQRNDELSGGGDGRVWQAELADPLWTADIRLATSYLDDAEELAAIIRKLHGAQESFFLCHPYRRYPRADPAGAVLMSLNPLRWTEAFDNTAWIKTDTTVVANATTAPDGTTAADKMVEGVANGAHTIQQNVTGNSGETDYTFSVFVKAAERTSVQVSLGFLANQEVQNSIILNLQSGSILAATVPSRVGAIQYPNGWWRIHLSVRTIAGSGLSLAPLVRTAIGTSVTYQGDGTSGLYIWGAQMEQGLLPSPYAGRADAAGPSTVTLSSVAAGRGALGLAGLPPRYALSPGDKGQIQFGSNPERTYFFEFSESAVTGADGVMPLIEVFPRVPAGISAGAAVILAKPACKMFVMPDTHKPGTGAGMTVSGAGLRAMERRR